MIRLENGTPIGPFRIQRFIKDGLFNGNYVAADAEGRPCFLKVFDLDAVPDALRCDDTVEEAVNSRKVYHPHVISYVDDGVVELQGKSYPWLAMQYFQGQLLSEMLREGRTFSGHGLSTDIFEASIVAYIQALNRLNAWVEKQQSAD